MVNNYSKACIFFLLGCLFISDIHLCAQDSTWVFSYPNDNFRSSAKLDLRYLNESFAGEHGFIRLSSDGESFVKGDGSPIRFWSVNNGSATKNMTDEELAQHARFMAKIGVNMGRFHGSINPIGKDTKIHEIDTLEVHQIWRYVAAMKKEGIYTTLSPFWPHNGHMGGWVPQEWRIDGYSENDDLWAVMYVDEKLQNAYKNWVRYLYTTPNPYTDIPLKDEPAVGLIQIQNEDGVFFWTMEHIKPELQTKYEKRFAVWLVEKYGTIAKAYERWGDLTLPEDKPKAGRMGLYQIFELTQAQSGAKAKRVADQTEFLARLQFVFYKEITRFYREELGCKQLINPNNWITADITRLNDLERWTYTAAEVPAVNRYNAPGHVGENNGWRIEPGHYYQGLSVLKNPAKLPINIKQISGHPMIVTESGWHLPHRYQAEGPFLIAAYQSLTGIDGYYWFAVTDVEYMNDPYFTFHTYPDGQHPLNRWTVSAPWGIGMFPANALMYRKGYIKQGKSMIMEKRMVDSLWARKVPLISEEASFDPNHDTGDPLGGAETSSYLNSLAFLTGPIQIDYTQEKTESTVSTKLDQLINVDNQIVKSNTGELALDYGQGVMILDTEQAQGVAGFMNEKKSFDLSTVYISIDNDYAVVQAVSMDGKPLKKSQKILVQMGTQWRPKGWKEKNANFTMRRKEVVGFEILNTGSMPWVGKALSATLTIRNRIIKHAWVLDHAGYPLREISMSKKGKKTTITLPHDALYLILEG